MANREVKFIVLVFVLLLTSSPAFAGDGRDLVLTPAKSPVPGERRLALVIGNSAYTGEGVHPLKNPANDANAMAAALQKLGFTVTEVLDADRDGIRDSVHAFAGEIGKSPQDVVALLYYSGHGMQVAGENYLIPIGFTMPKNAEDIGDNAYDVQRALAEMQSANARVNIVILDACRNNPYDTSRAVGGKGLVKMEPSGVYVAYATAEGKTADDNPDSPNGLYTLHLLKALQTPGLDIHQVFQATRRDVYEASDHEQYPYDYDGLLSDDFYFDGKGAAPKTVTPSVTPVDTVAHLHLTGVPDGASVTVDGASYPGSFPGGEGGGGVPIDIDLGGDASRTVRLLVTKSGFKSYAVDVILTPGVESDVPVSMDPLPVATLPTSGGKINPVDGAEMVFIPAGPFSMGDDKLYSNGADRVHQVTVDGYYIYKTPVTVAMYKKFCDATGHAMPNEPSWGWDKADYPIVNVTWNDAAAYCNWAGVSLPTEAQWEKAARGTDGRRYPWGNEWNPDDCRHSQSALGDAGEPVDVGSYPQGASPYGVLDMAGNVWQWCSDWYDADYFQNSPVKNPTGPSSGDGRVLKGGSWYRDETYFFCSAFRFHFSPDHSQAHGYIGFRCVSN